MRNSSLSAYAGVETHLDRTADMDTVEQTCFLLGNKHRQYVILFLLSDRTDDTLSAADLAVWIAAIEDNVQLDQIPYDRRKSIRMTLINNHLPKLDDADVIDHEATHNWIKPGSRFDEVARSFLQLLVTIGHAD